jgi:hypothetical protein
MSPRPILAAVLAASLLPAQDQAPKAATKDLAVLYAGEPGNPREKAFTEFLGGHFKKVDSISLEKLSEQSAKGYDVVVADWRRYYSEKRDEMGKGRAKVTLPTDWSRPTIMIGAVNGELTRPLQSKIDWL